MSDHLKPLPANSDQFRSVQIFQKFCQSQLDDKTKSEGKKFSSPIDPAKIMVVNRDFDDGKFELVYNDPQESFFCGAQISLNNHEMVARAGISETKTINEEAQMEMGDACSVAKHLVGNVEKGAKVCSDKGVSPKLLREEVRESSSIQQFEKYCTEKLNQKAIQMNWGEPVMPFAMERVQLINPGNSDPYYNLRYESLGQDFVCDAIVDHRLHNMLLRHSQFKEYPKHLASQTGTLVEMTDACTLTENLVGKEKFNGKKCNDKTDAERTRDYWTNIAFHTLVTGVAFYSLYKTGKKILPKVRGKFLPGLRVAGNAFLAGWVFDKTAGLFVSEENPIRKYGYYGALTSGALATVFWKRIATSTAGKAIGARLLSTRLVGPALSRLGGASLGTRFLAVMALDFGVQWLLVDGDYDASVNKRVHTKVFDKEVYDLDGWDLLVVPLAIKGLRAGTHLLAPNASEWAVAADNPEMEKKIRAEDLENSNKGKKMMKEVLPQLLASTSFYDPTDPESYRSIDLSRLENPIELNNMEKALSHYLGSIDPELAMETLGISEDKFEEMFQKIVLKNIQETASFIHFVDQDENDWSRYIFNKDGTLKSGQATSLVYELFKNDSSGMSASEQIYEGRKIQVIAAYLNQEQTFAGHDMDSVAYAAGILDEAGNLKVDGAFLTALTLYTSDAVQNKDAGKIKILEDLCTQLKWRYLKTGPYSREPIADALKVLGIDPSQAVDEKTFEGQMCFSKDSPQYFMDQLSKKYSNKLTGYYSPKR